MTARAACHLQAAAGLREGGVLKALAADFTEDLGVYKQGKKSKAELWEP